MILLRGISKECDLDDAFFVYNLADKEPAFLFAILAPIDPRLIDPCYPPAESLLKARIEHSDRMVL